MQKLKIFILFSFSMLFGQFDYSLEDLNSTSVTYGENVGVSYFSNKVTLHYFGHYN